MTIVLYLAIYASVACFMFGCARRIRQYATLPVHLRWELYPVPHESPERARYGGSYFEETDWWTKPRSFHWFGELRVMVPEILLLKSLWDVNRKLWWRSFAFHSGLYCIVASLFVRASVSVAYLLLNLSRIAGMEGLANGLGWLGLFLAIFGGLGLFWRRLLRP